MVCLILKIEDGHHISMETRTKYVLQKVIALTRKSIHFIKKTNKHSCTTCPKYKLRAGTRAGLAAVDREILKLSF